MRTFGKSITRRLLGRSCDMANHLNDNLYTIDNYEMTFPDVARDIDARISHAVQGSLPRRTIHLELTYTKVYGLPSLKVSP